MNSANSPDLSQLRDIHLPAPISWWPLAPVWWWVIGAVALSLTFIAWWWLHYRSNRWRRKALQELRHLIQMQSARQIAPRAMIVALSVLLRRVAISRFPRQQVASLNGEPWLAFLDSTSGGGTAFMTDIGRLLAVAPYVEEASIKTETLQALFDLSERWLKKLPARRGK